MDGWKRDTVHGKVAVKNIFDVDPVDEVRCSQEVENDNNLYSLDCCGTKLQFKRRSVSFERLVAHIVVLLFGCIDIFKQVKIAGLLHLKSHNFVKY